MKCRKCSIDKRKDEFYASNKSWCKECMKVYVRRRYASGYGYTLRALRAKEPRICSRCNIAKERTEFAVIGRHLSKCCNGCMAEIAAGMARKARDAAVKKASQPIATLTTEMLWNARKRCKAFNLPYDLDPIAVEKMVREFCDTHYHNLSRCHPFRPSIDRKVPEHGYTMENIKIVWVIENYARNRFTEDDVILFCKLKLGINPVETQAG